jgi:hypothetical protein
MEEDEMSREPLRAFFAGLALALVLAMAVPARGEAAGPRGEDPGPARMEFVPRWIVGLLEKLFGEIGWHIDPNGGGTATTTGDGDIGLHIDPDG